MKEKHVVMGIPGQRTFQAEGTQTNARLWVPVDHSKAFSLRKMGIIGGYE